MTVVVPEPSVYNATATFLPMGVFATCLRSQQRSYENRITDTKLHNPYFDRLTESFGARVV